MGRIFHVNERAFLNLPTNLRAYIIAFVEDTSPYPACSDKYEYGGQISLRIADCFDEIELHFDLSTKRERENSCYKAKTLAEILAKFRDAIETESKMIEERETRARSALGVYRVR